MDAALLDQEYRVIFGGLGTDASSLYPEEYAYLSGRRFPEDQLIRAEFTDTQGGRRDHPDAGEADGDGGVLPVLSGGPMDLAALLPLYLAAAGAFIAWMRRKIGHPLRRLQ